MTQPFAPQDHLIQLPRKVKDKATGTWTTVYDDYLEVKWRLCWFRDRYPHGTIETEELCVDLDRGYARYKARVADGEGGSATGHGTETKADFTDYCERAETRALGRALAKPRHDFLDTCAELTRPCLVHISSTSNHAASRHDETPNA
jgi:hypothetical protein